MAKFYKELKKKGKKFEIIWVSKDRSADEFVEYYMKMPWLAMTLENIQSKGSQLSSLYKVRGIPHFAIVDAEDGSVITLDGRNIVMQDKYGLQYPWRPRTLMSLIPKSVKRSVNAQLERMSLSVARFVRGWLDSLAPSKVVMWVVDRVKALLTGQSNANANANRGKTVRR